LPAVALACAALAADISGSWEFTVETYLGSVRRRLSLPRKYEFKQKGEKLSGTYSGRFGTAKLSGTVKGDQVEFTFEIPNLDGKVRYKGTLDGATRMKGDVEYGDLAKGTFTAKKK
jgi:hypothetical protein